MMDAARRAEIRSRADAATRGPWQSQVSVDHHDEAYWSIRTREHLVEHPWSPRFVAWLCGRLPWGDLPESRYCDACRHRCYRGREVAVDLREDPQIGADANFLAHARVDVPDLLDEVERLEAALLHRLAVQQVDPACEECQQIIALAGPGVSEGEGGHDGD